MNTAEFFARRPVHQPSEQARQEATRTIQLRTRPALVRDVAIVVIAFTVIFVLAGRYDLFEAFVQFVRPREQTQFDETLIALAVMPIVLVVLVGLRWRETRDALVRSVMAEQARELSTQRYHELFNACTSGISRWTLDGELVIANPSFAAMVGPDRMSPALRLGDLMDKTALADLLQDIREKGQIGPLEIRWQSDARTIDVRLTAALPQDQEPGVFDLFTHDATSERGLEVQLRHAQKMDAVGRLAGGVAHDFNNLLTVILNEAELAKGELPDEAPTQAALTGIIRASERAAILTRQLLTFSRRDVVHPTVFAVGDVVNDMARMLRRLIGEDVELKIQIAPTGELVRADRSQVEQVILNLVVNARDAMPNGGSLFIEAALRRLDAEYVAAHVGVAAGEYVMVAVSDSGLGMTPEVRERLFEPFFTTKSFGQGTGLGLATSFGIVKEAGGHIGVYSEPGTGTTMRVYLPRIHDTATAMPPAPAAHLLHPRDETILIVEDEAGVRQVVTRVLQRQGYTVLEATDGLEALRLMQMLPRPVDLVISDMVMPGLGGRDLADRIGKIHPGVKMLFMSGYTDDIVLKHRMLQRNVPFLQKPFTVNDFTNAVHAVLHDIGSPALGALRAWPA